MALIVPLLIPPADDTESPIVRMPLTVIVPALSEKLLLDPAKVIALKARLPGTISPLEDPVNKNVPPLGLNDGVPLAERLAWSVVVAEVAM